MFSIRELKIKNMSVLVYAESWEGKFKKSSYEAVWYAKKTTAIGISSILQQFRTFSLKTMRCLRMSIPSQKTIFFSCYKKKNDIYTCIYTKVMNM